MKDTKSKNPSAVKSREMITDALLSLMKKKQFSKITVTDVANEAQIVRKTFYHHFYTMNDVLDEYIEMLYMEYINELKEKQINSVFENVVLYFRFWSNHLEFLKLLQKHNLLIFMLTKYEELLPYLHQYLPCTLEQDTKEFEYYSAFTSAAFWRILCKWVERGGKETPEDMVYVVKRFFEEMEKSKKIPQKVTK